MTLTQSDIEVQAPCEHLSRTHVADKIGRQVCDDCKTILQDGVAVVQVHDTAPPHDVPAESPSAAFRRINAKRERKSKAATEKTDALAVTGNEKTDIMSAIHRLSDKVLVSHITSAVNTFIDETDKRFRTFSIDLQPYALEFMNRFKAEKKAGRHYLGFKDFDRACDNVLHYSSKQVRRIAIGQPTPPKPTVKHETEEEKASREAKQRLNARIELEALRLREEREASNQESSSLISETTVVPHVPVPVVIVPSQKDQKELKEYKLIAAKNISALEIADEILPLLYHVSNAKQHSQIMKYLKLRNIPLSAIAALEKKGVAA